MDIMPKGIYVPENRIQSGFFHYPKQQECLVDVLVQMSENGVTPDRETGDLIMSITGLDSAPMRKFGRMRYICSNSGQNHFKETTQNSIVLYLQEGQILFSLSHCRVFFRTWKF